MHTELVLCVGADLLASTASARGFLTDDHVDINLLLAVQHCWFAPRGPVEHRYDFRQVIPYVILAYEDSVVLYRRMPKGGETRLHGLFSIGFGGHVGLADVVMCDGKLDVSATLENAVLRELSEEVRHSAVRQRQVIGIIKDDTEDVSRVHLGVVEMWTLAEPFAESAETAIGECLLVPWTELHRYAGAMEGWSRLCADRLSLLHETQTDGWHLGPQNVTQSL